MAQKLLWRTHIQAVTTLRSNFAKKILVYDSVFTAQLTHTILAREKKQISIWSWTILGETPLYQLDSQSLKNSPGPPEHPESPDSPRQSFQFSSHLSLHMHVIILIYLSIRSTTFTKVQCHLHSFPHLLQECLVLKFMFVFIQVNFKFFNAAPSLHVHVITLIQFVCHFHIGCMKSIFSCSSSISSSLISTFLFKFKFIVIQRKLIFSIPSPDIKLMWLMWFHLHIHISTVIA